MSFKQVADFDPTDSHRVILKDHRLHDADMNPEAMAEAVLMPENDDGTRDAEVAVWNNYQDKFESKTVEDVHIAEALPLPAIKISNAFNELLYLLGGVISGLVIFLCGVIYTETNKERVIILLSVVLSILSMYVVYLFVKRWSNLDDLRWNRRKKNTR